MSVEKEYGKLAGYIKKARKLILGGVVVGLILGVGVWLVALNDLGARLATVGAFIAAILTPAIAFIANNVVPTSRKTSDGSTDQDTAPRNSKIIIASAVIALVVTVGVVWATPRITTAVQNYFYHAYDTESIDPSAITMTNNTDMKDGDVAQLRLPATRHGQLKLSFSAQNTASTTLCANAATFKITDSSGKTQTAKASEEKILSLSGKDDEANAFLVQLVFLPETDPSCRLDIAVASASYAK